MLTQIPYRPLKRLVRAIRIRYYTVPWPDDVPTYETTSVGPGSLEEHLRRHEAYEGMLISYRYEGEEMNLRRPAGTDEDGRQLELHIRGRTVDRDGAPFAQYCAHLEPSRYEHKTAHIEEDGLEWLTEDEIAALIADSTSSNGEQDAP